MRVTFWGTRGSIPRATTDIDTQSTIERFAARVKSQGHSTIDDLLKALKERKSDEPLSYGGNTTCTEVQYGNQSFLVDMGTGMRDAGTASLKEKRQEFDIFLTHLHWDHVMGFNFFLPVYSPTSKIVIHHVQEHTPEYVKICFNGINYPVKWEALGAKIEFRRVTPHVPIQFGDVKVTPFRLDHPGDSYGFRFDAGGKSFFVGVDSEFVRLSPEELGPDLAAYQKLDFLLFDAQYELKEIASRFDWGHCCAQLGVDLALRECIKTVAFSHHDPWAPEEKLQAMVKNARTYLHTQLKAYADRWKDQPGGPNLVAAYDGMTVEI